MPERDGRQGLTKNADLQSDCEPQRTVKNCENRVVAGSGTDTLNSDHIPQAESLTQREELFQKRTSRPRMESLVLSCHTSKPDLTPNQTAVSTSPRSVTFTQSTWNFLVSRSNSPDRPLPSPKDEVILSFLVLPFSAYKSLPFYPPLWSSFLSARWEAAPFMNHWTKPIRSQNVPSWVLTPSAYLSSSSRFSHELDINIPDCLLRKLRHGEVLGLFQGLTTRKDGSSEPRSSMSDRKDHVTPPPCREHKKSQPLFDFNKNMFLLKKTWSILSAAVFI